MWYGTNCVVSMESLQQLNKTLRGSREPSWVDSELHCQCQEVMYNLKLEDLRVLNSREFFNISVINRPYIISEYLLSIQQSRLAQPVAFSLTS